MLAAAAANGALGFVMLVTMCFCLGSLDDILSTPTGYPFIQASNSSESAIFVLIKTSPDILQRYSLEWGCNNHDLDPSPTELCMRGDKYGYWFSSALVLWP